MTVRVLLIAPAMSAAEARAAVFGSATGLDAHARESARAVAESAQAAAGSTHACVAASVRCRETAAVLGLDPGEAAAPAAWDVGSWRGRRLQDIAASEPDAVAAWLADPAAAPHGGESLLDLVARVGGWLAAAPAGRTVAVADVAVVRAAVVHALQLPAQAFWRLDVPPLSLTELSGRAGRWNLRTGRPLGP
ncbi:histidine phosphatase family protein [Streptomyces boninensis]|uniref:histidine phosphatase family protein n=1 Tax=Streptomyces boninensis TaxID=2039455 RepID=UPI003B21396E